MTVIALVPAGLGILSGIATRKEWIHRLYQRAGFEPLHYIPNAWDFLFGRHEEQWALVVLKDDTKYAGKWTSGSFASTDPLERDLLLVDVHNIPDDGPWQPTGKSVYIAAGEIRTIELTPTKA